MAASTAACTTAEAPVENQPGGTGATGGPTELALLRPASELGVGGTTSQRCVRTPDRLPFDARLKRMSTVDETAGDVVVLRGRGSARACRRPARPARRTHRSGYGIGVREETGRPRR
ncbi:hypothetical protein [Streptomyces sp. DvalAA-14]|uniref:hypothetical protein n=1 Tax=Streptomyces sp. DvalAA-14 TaxID=1839759 RepID=UPI00351F5877